jgi:hypothetical protein
MMNISMTATMPVREAAAGYRRVGATISAIEDLLDTCPDGIFEATIRDLAAVAGCDVDTVREAISALDPADHVLSVDVTAVSEIEPFTLEWAPVTAIVNLLLDWDLLTIEIATEELAQWLAASQTLATRALDRLGRFPGVKVCRPFVGGTVKIAIDPHGCPLTAEVPAMVA